MIFEAVAEVIANYKGIDGAAIAPETTLESLKISSLETVEMLMDLEDKLNCEITLDRSVKTVGELVDFIEGIQA